MDTSILFTPIAIGNTKASNRFIYQPTETNNCDSAGTPTEETFRVYRERAEGGPGILFVESIDVSSDCQARSNRMIITEENKEIYRELVSSIKLVNPEILVIFQLSHAGRLSDPEFRKPLFVYAKNSEETPMSLEDIRKASGDFVKAALLIDEIGGDGVDIKQAHGFLAGDFLHPGNLRPDQYGGSFENRTRFFREIFAAVKDKCRDDFIIGTRISPYEGIPGGCGTSGASDVIEDLTEMKKLARLLEEIGVDFINVSAGYAAANLEILLPTATYPEGVYRHFTWTRQIKEEVSIPVIGSGYSYTRDGNNSLTGNDSDKKSLLGFAVQNLKQKSVDLVGIGRQVFADPRFVNKVKNGQLDSIHWCTTCSGCGILLGNNKKIGCTVYDNTFTEILKSVE